MGEKIVNIKEGIKLHLINTDLFKTNLICVMLTVPLERKTVTLNALLPFLLKRGNCNLKDQYEINKKLEKMYGAIYDCGIDKVGDNQLIKFYIESVNDNFLPGKQENLKESLNVLLDIIFNPILENGCFRSEFLDYEKSNLQKVIEAKIDNKDKYAFDNCITAMYGDNGFGIYKYGYIEDLEKITLEEISNHYKNLISSAKIDIYISGEITEEETINFVKENENVSKLEARQDLVTMKNEERKELDNPKIIDEKMNINQGKLVMGYDIFYQKEDAKEVGIVYNAILGDGANSMMFQNVREKESLAYSARSNIINLKKNVFIRCGIEIENYEKAVETIKEQLKNIEEGKFSEEDITNAKKYLISSIQTIETEQDTQIVHYIGQEISNNRQTIEEYINKIEAVTKDKIIEFAKTVKLNTIYFLRN